MGMMNIGGGPIIRHGPMAAAIGGGGGAPMSMDQRAMMMGSGGPGNMNMMGMGMGGGGPIGGVGPSMEQRAMMMGGPGMGGGGPIQPMWMGPNMPQMPLRVTGGPGPQLHGPIIQSNQQQQRRRPPQPVASREPIVAPPGEVLSKDRVFIGGVHRDANDDDVRNVLATFGDVAEIKMPRDPDTGRHKGFGFVTFCSNGPVEELLRSTQFVSIRGKHAEIKPVFEKSERSDRGSNDKARTDRGKNESGRPTGVTSAVRITLVPADLLSVGKLSGLFYYF